MCSTARCAPEHRLKGAQRHFTSWVALRTLDAYNRSVTLLPESLHTFLERYAVGGRFFPNLALANTDLRALDLSGVRIQAGDFRRCDLYQSNLFEAELRHTDLRDANLIGADLSRSLIADCQLNGAFLSYARLRKARLLDSDFSRVTFVAADLREAQVLANFEGADLTRALLVNADLSGCFALGANFTRALLRGVNFRQSKLRRASFMHADLTGANLEGADLRRVRFDHARLDGASLRGALIDEADFTGVELADVQMPDV